MVSSVPPLPCLSPSLPDSGFHVPPIMLASVVLVQPFCVSHDWRHRLKFWFCPWTAVLWAAMTEDHCCGEFLSKVFPSVCKSVPVSPPWEFFPLTLPAVAPVFPFLSLLLLLNWDLIHSHTWHYSKPLWNPTLDTPSGIDGLLRLLEDHHFLLAPSKGLSFIFFLWLPGQVPQASLGGKGFEDQAKKLECHQAINEQQYWWVFLDKAWHDWTCAYGGPSSG